MSTTAMQKNAALKLMDQPDLERIVETAYRLLLDPGLKIHNDMALGLFAAAGAEVDFETGLVKLHREIVENALKTTPRTFTLYSLKAEPSVVLQSDNFYPYPGTSAIAIHDYKTRTFRKPQTKDLIDFITVVEHLPHMHLNSSFVCEDIPEPLSDIYRLALALKYSTKPIKISVFTTKDAIRVMKELFFAVSGGEKGFGRKPFAFISVNPEPPLRWSDFMAQVMIECAGSKIPLSRGSTALSGAASPVTLTGSLIQQTAEALSGITLSQLAQPGSPGLYGSAPIMFDVRKGTTPTGAIETLMLCSAAAQIADYLGVPTHLYTGISDSKLTDAQFGFESATGILVGALSGINLFPVGMLNLMLAQSLEGLVIANEICAQAYRLMDGIEPMEEDFNTDLWKEVGHNQDFLSTLHTLTHFKEAQMAVSNVIDRQSEPEWLQQGAKDTSQRAHEMVAELISKKRSKVVDPQTEEEIDRIVIGYAKSLGIGKDTIPELFFSD